MEITPGDVTLLRKALFTKSQNNHSDSLNLCASSYTINN